jgi:hypothetical protein
MTTGADLGQTLIPTHAGDRDGVLVDRLRAARDSAWSNRWDPGLTEATVDAGDGRGHAATVTYARSQFSVRSKMLGRRRVSGPTLWVAYIGETNPTHRRSNSRIGRRSRTGRYECRDGGSSSAGPVPSVVSR